jgi:hypothetical protein
MPIRKKWLCHNAELFTLKKSSYAPLKRVAMPQLGTYLQYGSFPKYGTYLQSGTYIANLDLLFYFMLIREYGKIFTIEKY